MTGSARADAPRPVTFSVMTYNVEGLPWPVRKGRGQALKAIGGELAAMRAAGRQPDVVLIQEGFRSEIWDLIDESGYPYVARGPNKGQRDPNVLDGQKTD